MHPIILLNLTSMLNMASGWLIVFVLLLLMLVALVLGRKVGVFISLKTGDAQDNAKPLAAAVFALTAFLLVFAFNMSGTRYDARREALISEANAIGTAILRADLYPDSVRKELRRGFNEYLEARISFYTVGPQFDSARYWMSQSEAAGKKLWATATTYARATNTIVPTGK